MNRVLVAGILAVAFIACLIPSTASAGSGRIYGTIRTIDGEEFEGWIRWDKNEAYWDDILDVTKYNEHRKKYRRKSDRGRSRESFFGISISGIYSDGSRQSELKFGHIRSIVPLSSSEALITLKSGEEYEMTGSDLGTSVRDIAVLDKDEGEVYFDWDDIDEILFSEESGAPDDGAERLYGKLTTRRGDEYVGWIEWDVDEVMSTDILDGDEGRRRNRKIRFDKIQVIERRSNSSVLLTLKSGKEMKLSGSNDVNSENRGIRVKSAELGRVSVDWSEFDKVEFMTVPTDKLLSYSSFDGGRELKGTVFTEDGEQFTGKIIWDDDEMYTWEHLNGEYRDIEYDIELANIATVEKQSRRGSVITTKAGRNVVMRGSNDVDSDNNGIIIETEDGDEIEIDWYDFQKAEFK